MNDEKKKKRRQKNLKVRSIIKQWEFTNKKPAIITALKIFNSEGRKIGVHKSIAKQMKIPNWVAWSLVYRELNQKGRSGNAPAKKKRRLKEEFRYKANRNVNIIR